MSECLQEGGLRISRSLVLLTLFLNLNFSLNGPESSNCVRPPWRNPAKQILSQLFGNSEHSCSYQLMRDVERSKTKIKALNMWIPPSPVGLRNMSEQDHLCSLLNTAMWSLRGSVSTHVMKTATEKWLLQTECFTEKRRSCDGSPGCTKGSGDLWRVVFTQFYFNFRFPNLALSVRKGSAGSCYYKAASVPVSSGVLREKIPSR